MACMYGSHSESAKKGADSTLSTTVYVSSRRHCQSIYANSIILIARQDKIRKNLWPLFSFIALSFRFPVYLINTVGDNCVPVQSEWVSVLRVCFCT